MYIPYTDKPALTRFVAEWNEAEEARLNEEGNGHKFEPIKLEFKNFRNYCETFELHEHPIIGIPNSRADAALVAFAEKHNENITDPALALGLRGVGGGAEVEVGFPSASFSLSKWAKGDVLVQRIGSEYRGYKVLDEVKPEHVKGAVKVVRIGCAKQQWFTDKELFEKEKLSRPAPTLMHLIAGCGEENEVHGSSRDYSTVNSIEHAIVRCRKGGIIERITRDGTIQHQQPDGTFKTLPVKHPCPGPLFGPRLGLFGFVQQIEYECLPAYNVDVKIEKRNWTQVKAEIRDPNNRLFQSDQATHCMIVPTGEPDEATSNHKNTIVFRENRVPLNEHKENTASDMAPSKPLQVLMNKFSDLVKLGKMLNKFPKLGKIFNKYFVSTIEIGFHDERAFGPSYEIQHYLAGYPHGVMDTSFISEDDENCEGMIQRIDGSFALLQESEFQEELPVSVIFARRVKAHNLGGISPFSRKPGSTKPDKNANDYVVWTGVKSYLDYQAKLEEKVYPNDDTHYGKMQPPHFDVRRAYPQGYVEFVTALLWDECKDLEEFNQFKCDPNNPDDWSAILKKIHRNPFLCMELDEFLHLNKFTVEEIAQARREEAMLEEKTIKPTLKMELETFIKELTALHKKHHGQEVHEHEHGRSLLEAATRHLKQLASSGIHPLGFTASSATVSTAPTTTARNDAKLIPEKEKPKSACFSLCGRPQ